MSINFFRLVVLASFPLLVACQATPRYAYQPPVQEEPIACCCPAPEHSSRGEHEHHPDRCTRQRCRTMRPDHLDDFGPRPGQRRIIRCDHWQNINQLTARCPV